MPEVSFSFSFSFAHRKNVLLLLASLFPLFEIVLFGFLFQVSSYNFFPVPNVKKKYGVSLNTNILARAHMGGLMDGVSSGFTTLIASSCISLLAVSYNGACPCDVLLKPGTFCLAAELTKVHKKYNQTFGKKNVSLVLPCVSSHQPKQGGSVPNPAKRVGARSWLFYSSVRKVL